MHAVKDVSFELRYKYSEMNLNSNETPKVNPLTFNSEISKWLSSFNLFERCLAEILNIKGKWTVPRGGCKQLKTNDITTRWYENQSVLLEDVKLKEYKEFLQRIAGVDDLDSTPPQNASLKNIQMTSW